MSKCTEDVKEKKHGEGRTKMHETATRKAPLDRLLRCLRLGTEQSITFRVGPLPKGIDSIGLSSRVVHLITKSPLLFPAAAGDHHFFLFLNHRITSHRLFFLISIVVPVPPEHELPIQLLARLLLFFTLLFFLCVFSIRYLSRPVSSAVCWVGRLIGPRLRQ